MDKIVKYYSATVKSFDEAKKTAQITLSTNEVDRDGDIVEPAAFKKSLKDYKKHAVLLSSHRQDSLTRQIGEGKSFKISDAGVDGEYEWYVGKGNPEADWGYFLITRGVASFSIGFIGKSFEVIESKAPDGTKYISGRRFTDIELMEVSQVLIPANRGALQANRAAGELCEVALKSFKDEDLKEWSEKEAKPAEKTEKDATEQEEKPSLEDLVKQIMSDYAPEEIHEALSKHLVKEPKKHYTDDLFGKGDESPIPAPAKEQSVDDRKEKRKQAVKDALSAAIG